MGGYEVNLGGLVTMLYVGRLLIRRNIGVDFGFLHKLLGLELVIIIYNEEIY